MDENKRIEIMKLCKKIEDKNGEGSIYSLGSKKANMNIPRFSTCIEDLDYVLGGGIPKGRIMEIFGPESCLTEDTFVKYRINDYITDKSINSKGGTIKNLYERFHGLNKDGRKNRIDTSSDRYYFTVPSINEHDRIFHNIVANVVKCGVKPCYKVVTEKGFVIKTTKEHKFYIGNGKYKPLKKIFIGDTVYVHNNTHSKEKKEKNIKRINYPEVFVKYYPAGVIKKINDKKTGKVYTYYRARLSHLVYEASMNGYDYNDFINLLNDITKKDIIDDLEFIKKGFDIHHKDGDVLNNKLSNLELVFSHDHYYEHAIKNQYYMSFVAVKDKIKSIEYIGEKMTYDIKCYAPYNNYIANNFVVHNSGKTSLGLHLCGLCEMALYVAAEGTFDAERAKILGNRPKQLLVYRPNYGEDALDRVMEFTKAGIPLIVVDSVPALMPKEDYDKVDKSLENEHRIGGVARLLNKALPVLEREVEKSGTTIVFINQIRDKMNAMLFGEKTDTPGGRALKFYCSVRIQVGRRAWIEVPNKDPRNSSDKQKIGIITKCKVVKSKICNPFGECEIPMIFDRGYVSHDDVLEIRKEIMNNNRKKQRERKVEK